MTTDLTAVSAQDGTAAFPSSPLALLRHSAPDSTALTSSGQNPITYAELSIIVAALSSRLAEIGIGAGSRIVTALGDGPLSAAMTLSVVTIGTCCPLKANTTRPELCHLFSRLSPSALIVEDGVFSAAASVASQMGVTILRVATAQGELGRAQITGEASPEIAGSDRAGLPGYGLVLQTSGTTGVGKLVPLPWKTMHAAASATARAYALTARDRRLNITPLTHIQGAVGSLLATLVSGGSIVLAAVPEYEALPQVLDELAVTWFSASPVQHRQILAGTAGRRFRSLRFVRVGSSALSRSLRRQLERFYRVPVVESYGMTEAHQIASTALPPAPPRQGLVATGSEVAICTDDGCLTREPGHRGELVVRGSNVAAAYLAPAAVDADQFANGWFHTGDQGEFLHDRSFRITGRVDELINRGGCMISPIEIEEALLKHPHIADAGAFALPHRVLGQQLAVAVVVNTAEPTSATAIRDFLRTLLSPRKLPDQVVFCDRLPSTDNGKVSRVALSARWTGEEEQDAV